MGEIKPKICQHCFFVRLRTFQIVLIDDDFMIRTGWKMQLQKVGITCHLFATVDDFLAKADGLDKSTPVYVDSSLGNDVKGEVASEEIFKKGFQHIYLATGYDPSEFDLILYPWIKKITGKTAPVEKIG